MFMHLSIHKPRPGKAEALIDSMHRFGAAMEGRPGLREVHTLRDEASGQLIGLALWDSRADWSAARPFMAAAVENDPFEDWEEEPPQVFHLERV